MVEQQQQQHNPSFEKNIPEEFQRAFLKENAVRSSLVFGSILLASSSFAKVGSHTLRFSLYRSQRGTMIRV
jgi:hypothetical protein